MPLNPLEFSAAMTRDYRNLANLNEDNKPKSLGVPTNDTFPIAFANNYDDYAKKGVVLGATNVGGDKSILVDAMINSRNLLELSVKLSEYWSTVAIVQGPPGYGGTPVSVVNDATAHVNSFRSALLASQTTSVSLPFYFQMINNIQTMAINKINWTVTENFGSSGNRTFISKII